MQWEWVPSQARVVKPEETSSKHKWMLNYCELNTEASHHYKNRIVLSYREIEWDLNCKTNIRKVNRFRGKRIQRMLCLDRAGGIFEEKRVEKFRESKAKYKMALWTWWKQKGFARIGRYGEVQWVLLA